MHGISSRRPRSVSRGKGRVRLPLIGWPCLDWGCCLRLLSGPSAFQIRIEVLARPRDHRLLANYRSDADVRHIDGSN